MGVVVMIDGDDVGVNSDRNVVMECVSVNDRRQSGECVNGRSCGRGWSDDGR